jgi:23S rRNA (guanosine2251-2'-O)-methyltransferase
VGVEAGSNQSYTKADFTMPVALVIGSEGSGLAEQVKKNCDFLVSIPMCGHVNSLNASVAAAIVMYEVVRQRNK